MEIPELLPRRLGAGGLLLLGWGMLDVPTLLWCLGRNPVAVWFQCPLGFLHEPEQTLALLTAAWYLAGVGLLVVGYPSAVERLRHAGVRVRRAWTLVLAFLAAAAIPFASHDFFNYFGQIITVAVYHRNPMLTTVASLPHWRSNFWLAHATWQHTVSPYGPLWVGMMRGLGFTAGSFVGFFILWKAACLAMVFALGWLIDRRRPDAGFAFILHPAVGIELLANAHNDVLMLLPLVVGYWAWTKRLWLWAGLSLGVSVGVKYLPGVLLPILGGSGMGIGALTVFWSAGAFPVAAGWATAWHGWRTFTGPLLNTHLFLRSPAFVLQGVLVHVGHLARHQAESLATRIGLTAWAAATVGLALRFRTRRSALAVGDIFLVAAILGMSWFQFWYVTWALPFYCLSAKPRARRMVMAIAAAELVRGLGWAYGGGGALMPVWMQLMETVLLWAILAGGVWRRAYRAGWLEQSV